MCRNLRTQYVDLYLIHWPLSMTPGTIVYPPRPEDLLPMDMKSVWAAIEECQKLGLITKSIGVSNFSCKKLDDLLSLASIPPAVNQVELNPYWQQKKLRDYFKAKGIVVAAYSPLGAAGTMWGSSRVMESELLKGIAESKGNTIAQVCLRWAYEQEIAIVVKSYNKERMKQNLDIFDWALSQEESKKIGEMPQIREFKGEPFISASMRKKLRFKVSTC